MQTQSSTIGFVDDFPALRKGLALLFKKDENWDTTLEAGNGKELKKILNRQTAPEIILLDMRMPEMSGLETMEWLHHNHPEIKTIIYTDCNTELTLTKLYLLGARAVLQRNIDYPELLKAIKRVKEEGYYYHDSFSRNLLIQLHQKNEKQRKTIRPVLSEKELHFLRLIVEDKTYKEMSVALNVSSRIVDKIRNRLFEKLGVKSKEALAVKAMENCIESR